MKESFNKTLIKDFNIKKPRIAISGVNPHAGEEGSIGNEELQWMMPLLQKWRTLHPKLKIYGPVPPDTCWISAAKQWNGQSNKSTPDGILALYHDQGLIPMKLIAFVSAVNTTLGLPFIRITPDHGPNYKMFRLNRSKPDSLIQAFSFVKRYVD